MLTKADWEARAKLAYQDERCPNCGLTHFPCDVDRWGVVWVSCQADGRFYCVGFEPLPSTFADEPDPAADLPI